MTSLELGLRQRRMPMFIQPLRIQNSNLGFQNLAFSVSIHMLLKYNIFIASKCLLRGTWKQVQKLYCVDPLYVGALHFQSVIKTGLNSKTADIGITSSDQCPNWYILSPSRQTREEGSANSVGHASTTRLIFILLYNTNSSIFYPSRPAGNGSTKSKTIHNFQAWCP